jgi:thioredoxin-like negative regulator of GroEL
MDMKVMEVLQQTTPLREKPLLLHVWDVECPACLGSMAFLSELREKFGEQLQTIGLCVNTDSTAAQEFTEKYQINWPQICDGQGWNGELVMQLGVEHIPKVYLFDAKGKQIPTDLEDIIASLLAEN